jgi:mRNA interferase MazF
MKKDFVEKYNNWNIKKQDIQFSERTEKMYFKEGDIWWCALGLNIGSESFGKGENFRRPVLIVKKLSGDLCIVLPLTSKEKTGTWFIDITLQGEKKWAMLYQIRTLNKKRFTVKIGELDDTDFARVKEKLDALLELSANRHPTEAGIEGSNPKSNTIVVGGDNKVK